MSVTILSQLDYNTSTSSSSWTMIEESTTGETIRNSYAGNDSYDMSSDQNDFSEDPLNTVKNHLIIVFVIVSFSMLCCLLLCINSFFYDDFKFFLPKQDKRLKHYKGKLMYPLPWEVTIDSANQEYSFSDLKEEVTNAVKIKDCPTCNCDQWDDDIDFSVSTTNICYRTTNDKKNDDDNQLVEVNSIS